MTQEEKELLLKDLCARLQYGVKIKRSNCPIILSVTGILGEYIHHIPFYIGGNIEINTTKIDEIKPYLRPMSSMTEEEKETHECFFNEDGLINCSVYIYVDWLLEHHFDYRGLIPMGLALEATEEMYNTKTE